MGRRGSVLALVVINVIVTLVVAFVVISIINSQNTNQPANQVVITVPVLITATKDPNVTESVIIITATPLPGTPNIVLLPTGLLDGGDAQAANAPTVDQALLDGNTFLQETATALPPNCILHTIEEGDTPFGIAVQYGADPDALMAVNGLDEASAGLLQIGDVLIVPLEGCPLAEIALTATQAATEEPTAGDTPAPTGLLQTPTVPATASLPPSLTPTATLPPTATNAQVEIVRVLSPGDINAEGVDIRNNGATVNLKDWKLSDNAGNTYTFSEQFLFTNAVLTVFTRVGAADSALAKYWGRDTALWTSGSTLTLTDSRGSVQSTYSVP